MIGTMSELSSIPMPETLGVIAGLGSYPWQLARSAHAQGVKRVVAFAFKGETERVIAKYADEVVWMHLGSLQALLDAVQAKGVAKLVMAGQIKPTRLFNLRLDAKALAVLRTLKVRNAHTIFGAIGDELRAIGAELLPAYCFMETEMPAAGTLGRRAPDEREQADVQLGAKVAKVTSGLEIGQTVVVKEGTVLAVEGFEGTDETILRAGRLGGPGGVVVKVAKLGHDMRFDIPIVGLRTFKMLKKAKISCLAVEAKRTILLERDKLAAEADRLGIAFVAFDAAKTEPI
ncbi:MAG: LpxI family protein [Spartobacteria bacterium]|nr:LpxI family protein [Spartobacteria bacterium]